MISKIKQNPTDPIGTILSATLLILSTLGLAEKFDITADELGMVVGALGVIATTIRGVAVARKGPVAAAPAEPEPEPENEPEEKPERESEDTPSETDTEDGEE